VSLFGRWRVRRDRDGYGIRLPEAERALLAHLPGQLAISLTEISSDGAVPDGLERLFPHAHPIDRDAESRFVEATREDLVSHHRESLELVARTSSATHLTEDEADAWLSAINTLRLAIGTRLDITEEHREVLESDPAYADWICYQYLSYLEGELVEAMMGALPPPRPGAGDDLPEDPWGEPLGGLRWDGTPAPEPPPE
jgi:hypothetical protein